MDSKLKDSKSKKKTDKKNSPELAEHDLKEDKGKYLQSSPSNFNPNTLTLSISESKNYDEDKTPEQRISLGKLMKDTNEFSSNTQISPITPIETVSNKDFSSVKIEISKEGNSDSGKRRFLKDINEIKANEKEEIDDENEIIEEDEKDEEEPKRKNSNNKTNAKNSNKKINKNNSNVIKKKVSESEWNNDMLENDEKDLNNLNNLSQNYVNDVKSLIEKENSLKEEEIKNALESKLYEKLCDRKHFTSTFNLSTPNKDFIESGINDKNLNMTDIHLDALGKLNEDNLSLSKKLNKNTNKN